MGNPQSKAFTNLGEAYRYYAPPTMLRSGLEKIRTVRVRVGKVNADSTVVGCAAAPRLNVRRTAERLLPLHHRREDEVRPGAPQAQQVVRRIRLAPRGRVGDARREGAHRAHDGRLERHVDDAAEQPRRRRPGRSVPRTTVPPRARPRTPPLRPARPGRDEGRTATTSTTPSTPCALRFHVRSPFPLPRGCGGARIGAPPAPGVPQNGRDVRRPGSREMHTRRHDNRDPQVARQSRANGPGQLVVLVAHQGEDRGCGAPPGPPGQACTRDRHGHGADVRHVPPTRFTPSPPARTRAVPHSRWRPSPPRKRHARNLRVAEQAPGDAHAARRCRRSARGADHAAASSRRGRAARRCSWRRGRRRLGSGPLANEILRDVRDDPASAPRYDSRCRPASWAGGRRREPAER